MKRIIFISVFCTLSPAIHAAPDLSDGRKGPTPYDPFLQTLKYVFVNLNGPTPSFDQVRLLLIEGHNFQYVADSNFTPSMPEVTEVRRTGDCKAKSLWLAQQMNDPEIRFVIGRVHSDSLAYHAWLMWKSKNQWWILDPTNATRPIHASQVADGDYVIAYSYDRRGSYCHNVGSNQGQAKRVVIH